MHDGIAKLRIGMGTKLSARVHHRKRKKKKRRKKRKRNTGVRDRWGKKKSGCALHTGTMGGRGSCTAGGVFGLRLGLPESRGLWGGGDVGKVELSGEAPAMTCAAGSGQRKQGCVGVMCVCVSVSVSWQILRQLLPRPATIVKP